MLLTPASGGPWIRPRVLPRGRTSSRPERLWLSRVPQRSSDNSTGVSALRDHLHRYWFTFDDPPKASFFGLGCGVTAVDRDDAERLLRSAWFAADGLPRIHAAIEDVDVRDLDASHVLPNMGDPSIRGVWYPRR
jgi:hypothetical protein